MIYSLWFMLGGPSRSSSSAALLVVRSSSDEYSLCCISAVSWGMCVSITSPALASAVATRDAKKLLRGTHMAGGVPPSHSQ